MARRVGTTTLSEWVEVSQKMIDTFADATGDHQFIHVDPERAKLTPFGGTITHGLLTLSMIPPLAAKLPDAPRVARAKLAVNYVSTRLLFPPPVRTRTEQRLFEEGGVTM